eukprot:1158335-Pelagomonas_calceolata.AAC.20
MDFSSGGLLGGRLAVSSVGLRALGETLADLLVQELLLNARSLLAGIDFLFLNMGYKAARCVECCALVEHGEREDELVKYHEWVALPLKPLPVHGVPFTVHRYLHLD